MFFGGFLGSFFDNKKASYMYLFVGSLLIACGQAGAYTVGSDIDFKLLHGLGM